jgi:hypothetical protein
MEPHTNDENIHNFFNEVSFITLLMGLWPCERNKWRHVQDLMKGKRNKIFTQEKKVNGYSLYHLNDFKIYQNNTFDHNPQLNMFIIYMPIKFWSMLYPNIEREFCARLKAFTKFDTMMQCHKSLQKYVRRYKFFKWIWTNCDGSICDDYMVWEFTF